MRGSPRDLAQRPLPSMMIAMLRGTVFTLEDIRLTSGIWHQEANVWKSRMTNLEEMTNGSMAKTTRVILSGAKRNRKDLVELPEGFAAGFLDSTRNDRVDPRFSQMPPPDYRTIVSPRAGPTLTIDNFAPVNSQMYLTYFFAAKGS